MPNLIIQSHDSVVTRLRDVATVIDSVEDVKQSAWLGTRRCVIIDCSQTGGI